MSAGAIFNVAEVNLMTTIKFSRLGFAGVYNLNNSDQEGDKFRIFISLLQDLGASFCPETSGRVRLLDTAQMNEHFGSAARSEWAGRLFIPPRVLHDSLEQYVNSLSEKSNEWKTTCENWLATVRRLGNIFVTVDIPSPGLPLPTLIAYWTVKPTFWPFGSLSLFSQVELDAERAAIRLLHELYDCTDNLLSAMLFSYGGFSYPKDRLRKLAFIYFTSTTKVPEDTTESDYGPIYRDVLGRSNSELRIQRVANDQAIIFSKGFVGMTGQPEIGDVPDIVLVATHSDSLNDGRTLSVLRRLAIVEKSAYLLNKFTSVPIPTLPAAFPEGGSNAQQATSDTSARDIKGESLQSISDPILLEVIRRGSLLLTEFGPEKAKARPETILRVLEIPTDIMEQAKDKILAIDADPYSMLDEFRDRAYSIFADLMPKEIVQQIKDIRYTRQSPGALLITGLPTDDDPGLTPSDGKRVRHKRSFVSEACLLGLGFFLGEPYGFVNEKDGEIIHNVCPVKGREDAKSNEGSIQDFYYHTEIAFHPLRPDFLMLNCLRPDHDRQALTHVVDVGAIYSFLSEEDIALLRQAEFIVQAPASFHQTAKDVSTPVLLGDEGAPELRLNFNAMLARSDAAKSALDRLKEALRRETMAVALGPGDMLMVNNRRAVHGRNRFTPRYDGYDRWLQRLYIRETIWDTDSGLTSPNRIVK